MVWHPVATTTLSLVKTNFLFAQNNISEIYVNKLSFWLFTLPPGSTRFSNILQLASCPSDACLVDL